MFESHEKRLSARLPEKTMEKLNCLAEEAGHSNKTQILIDLINKADDNRAFNLLKKIDADNAKLSEKLDIIMALLAKRQ